MAKPESWKPCPRDTRPALATVAAVASRFPFVPCVPFVPSPRPPAAGATRPRPAPKGKPFGIPGFASAGVFRPDRPARIGASRPPQTRRSSAGQAITFARQPKRFAIPFVNSLHGSPRMAASPRRSQARERSTQAAQSPRHRTQHAVTFLACAEVRTVMPVCLCRIARAPPAHPQCSPPSAPQGGCASRGVQSGGPSHLGETLTRDTNGRFARLSLPI